MFVDTNQADKDRLRQGDILRDVPFPLIDVGKVKVLASLESEGSLKAVQTEYRLGQFCNLGQVPLKPCFCAVVSQCCEVQPNSRGKLIGAAFCLARLIPIKDSILEDNTKLTSLRQNRDPRDPRDPGYIDYFYVSAHPALQNREWMVDYGQLVSLPASNFPAILTHKVLQMDDPERVKFKIKLATFLGRLTDEEQGKKLENPWVGGE